ncbi:MAG: Uma2 family endonuclease [Caldilineaceae bacterium]
MNDLILLDEVEEVSEMGSYNHSTTQANLAFLLKRTGKYTVSTELSLDVSQFHADHITLGNEIRPDVCIYPKRGMSRPYDILKMTEMPLLAVEILSPKQGSQEILEKFEVYFALGVKSCWLVDPTTEVVTVYSTLEQPHSFSVGEVVDEKLGIRLPLEEVFE